MPPIDKLPNVQAESSSPVRFIKTIGESLSFRAGDVLQALVVEKLSSNEVLLAAKGSTLLARSDLPLRAGDRLHLKVENTSSLILLNLIVPADEETLQFRNNLAMFRSFPEGLLNVVKNGLEIFHGDLQPVFQFINKADIDSLLKILNSLIYSEKSLANPFFLKDYILNIGYLLESDLKKSLNRSNEKGDNLHCASNKNFKSLLSDLSSQLHQIMNDAANMDLDPQILKSLKSLSNYTDDSLKTIYNHQVANVIGQEEDQGYYFQIPFKLADNLRMMDLFINLKDRNGEKIRNNDHFQFVMFLNMDALGDLMVDVRYNQKKIWGMFKCVSSESRDFLSAFLEALNERLILSGYGPNYFNVQVSSDLPKEKSDFIKDKIIYSKEIVNCFV